jgi:hypothetical protein
VQGRGSNVGAAFDISVDVVGISAVFACLAWRLVSTGQLPLAEALALMALVVVYNWALAYRKALAQGSGRGDGGSGGMLPVRIPGLARWAEFCRRVGMSPLPWSVEAEIFALGLGPLLLPERWVPFGLHCALVFYLLANLVNFRRIWHLAATMDSDSTNDK